jgi:serpin B
MALSIAAECAEGNTKSEFITALGAEDIDDLRSENDSLFRSLYFDKYTAYCKIANSLWLNNKWTFKQNTLDNIADKYYAVSFERDFHDPGVPAEISGWINKNTSGKFTPTILIPEPDLEIMKIINTVTFKDAWSSKFGKAEKDTFVKKDGTEVNCDFMGYTKLYKDVGFADKYMRCSETMKNGFEMHFILPDEGVTVEELVSDDKIMEEIYSDSIEHEKRKTVFSVPKFDAASKFDLIEASKSLGIKDAFSKVKGDFSGVIDYKENNIPSAYISEITHEAVVTIDEEGCEAAAYTIISMVAGSAAPPEEEPVIFELKRPFFYYIADKNGTPLFAGIMNDPLEKNE